MAVEGGGKAFPPRLVLARDARRPFRHRKEINDRGPRRRVTLLVALLVDRDDESGLKTLLETGELLDADPRQNLKRIAHEFEQELGLPVCFVPHLLPIDRGILETIYARLRDGAGAADVQGALEAAYTGSPFVRLTGPDLPEIKHVAHTNFCDIGWRISPDGRQLVMVACIDNLVKGAAGQAIQNMNLMLGFEETEALL